MKEAERKGREKRKNVEKLSGKQHRDETSAKERDERKGKEQRK